MPSFEIHIRGPVGPLIREAFPELQMQRHGGVEILSGGLNDQSALYGVLRRIEELGLEVVVRPTPTRRAVSIELLERAAAALYDLLPRVVFVGGATIPLWISDPAAPPARLTNDVDVVVEVVKRAEILGFDNPWLAGVRIESRPMDSEAVKEFFERVSTDWDDMRSSFYNADVIDALADRTRLDRNSTVVDVGTGTGFVAAGLAGRVASVVGVDNAPSMLAVARRSLDALGVENVSLIEGQIDALPLGDDSVDVAVANMVLHHAPDPALMLAEMARVVRPGGRVAITDEIAHDYEWMRAEQADLWLGFTPDEISEFFARSRLEEYGYATLGMQ